MVYFAFSTQEKLSLNDFECALLSYIYAQQNQEPFFLLIDDRKSQQEESLLLDILKKFSIDTNEKIYQSKNSSIYTNMALQLLKSKKAYPCFCQENHNCNCSALLDSEVSELKAKKKFRIKVISPKKPVRVFDFLEQQEIQKELESFEILDENGLASASFAKAIDTMLYNISAIFSKNKQESLEQNYIQTLLGFQEHPSYAHLPPLESSITLQELLEEGFLPDAIINYIIALHFQMAQKIFYLPDAIEHLSWDSFRKTQKQFDKEELKRYNKEHLEQMESKKLSFIVGFADSAIGELLKLYLKKYALLSELQESFAKIFAPKKCDAKMQELSKIIFEAPMIEEFEAFINYLEQKSSYTKEEIESLLYALFALEPEISLKEAYSYLKPYLLEVAQCQ